MGTLKDVLSLPEVVWDWERTFDALAQTIQAVQVLHDYDPQIVHRDLKTLNLLVDKNWHIKVCGNSFIHLILLKAYFFL